MSGPGWGLDAKALDVAFPFHLVLDEDLCIRQVGTSLRRLCPTVRVGGSLDASFELVTPKVPATFAGLRSQPRAVFQLRHRANQAVRLRGQVLHSESEGVLFFIGSPWVTDTASFAALGLSLNDFAVSDPVVDFVLLLQSQAASLTEAATLAGQLHDKTQELTHLAYHDLLTGLPNRMQFLDRLEKAIAERPPGASNLMVLMLDLDGFKAVNDSLGHSAGDELLKVVAQRLRRTARSRDTLARLGGDEFAVLVEWPASSDDARQAVGIASRALEALRAPVRLPSHSDVVVQVTASIGIAVYAGHETAEELLRDADLAMYDAKSSGKDRFQYFEPAMHSVALARIELTEAIRRAVTDEEFTLHYQPLVDARSGVVTGVEALVRWDHPQRGLIRPDEFIPVAEATGTIAALGAWVLRTACGQVRAWNREHGGEPLRLSVNVSAAQLSPGFPDEVATVLAETGFDPTWLMLEITESMLAEDDPQAMACLHELAARGIALSVDDFGTGYSSLNRLQTFPITELKVDKSFVDGVGSQGSSAPLVTSIIALAHGLGLEVVAEGVETQEQYDFLVAHGCERAQGYLLGRPVAASELGRMLADRRRLAGAGRRPEAPSAGLETDAGIRRILHDLATLTGFESTYLTRIDWDARVQEILYSRNTGELTIAEGGRFELSETLCQAMLEGGPRLTAQVPVDYPQASAAADLDLMSYAGVPVRDREGATVGTLCAASTRSRRLDQRTTRIMELLAESVVDHLPEAGGSGPTAPTR
ncbi:MAG: EAL domain-containing protein [Actinomycetes bacterium]